MFVDECGVAPDLTRRYARAPGGRRAPGAVPYGRWTRLTVIGGLSLDGLVAPMSIPSACDTAVMVAFCRHVLVPALRPGQVVVMDNLSSHKVSGIREAIEAAGADLLYLPPYSPDYFPIENCWSKLKVNLRKTKARTREALEDALKQAIESITDTDAKGWFKQCGYSLH